MVKKSRKEISKENLGLSPGFSLLELVIVMAIMGVLTTLAVPSVTIFRNRAERLVCNGNLRSLHASLSSYLTDHKRWPQVPEEMENEETAKFWVDTLKDHGATTVVWLCPSIRRRYKEDPASFSHNPVIHYTPAEFDEHQFTPYKWPAMPWVLEIGSFHGDGNMMIRGDGGIRELNELLREAGGNGVHQLE